MGETRLRLFAVLALLAAPLPATDAAAAAQARFMSYPTEAQCVAGHALPAALCASAFARARSAFEARTTAYPILEQCAKAYGSCAPWPAGARRSFRPPFDGVDIVDTPGERSVTPASPLRRLRFAALPLSGPEAPERELTVRGGRRASVPVAPTGPARPGRPPTRPSAAAQSRPVAPPPGSGFRLEDGVLTYPAPARFQPKNLPKQP